MTNAASYEEGHLVVAAVRILDHRNGHPPTIEEIAELTKLTNEWTGVLVSSLADLGILRRVQSAFTLRLEVGNHQDLEKLSRASRTPTLDDEMKAFSEKQRREQEAMGRLFTEGRAKRDRKRRGNDLAEQLKAFKSKPPKGSDLFRDLVNEDD